MCSRSGHEQGGTSAHVDHRIESIAADRSVLVIEHDMEFVRRIARTVTVLHQGSVLCEGKFDEVQANPKVREVYLGRGKAR